MRLRKSLLNDVFSYEYEDTEYIEENTEMYVNLMPLGFQCLSSET
jgi:hypothetical protein